MIEGRAHRRSRSAQDFQALIGDQRLVGAVQRDHGDGRAAREDPRRGFGVDVEIELRGRGDVAALRHGAAHQHNARQVRGQSRLARHGQRHVG